MAGLFHKRQFVVPDRTLNPNADSPMLGLILETDYADHKWVFNLDKALVIRAIEVESPQSGKSHPGLEVVSCPTDAKHSRLVQIFQLGSQEALSHLKVVVEGFFEGPVKPVVEVTAYTDQHMKIEHARQERKLSCRGYFREEIDISHFNLGLEGVPIFIKQQMTLPRVVGSRLSLFSWTMSWFKPEEKDDGPIRFVFETFGNRDKASARLRAWKLMDELKTAGHIVSTDPQAECDVYVCQKVRPFERMGKHVHNDAVATVFDFDDNYFLQDKGDADDLIAFMQHADLVTVGSATLREEALRHHPNVYLLENPVDIEKNSMCRTPTEKCGRIGWFGAPENLNQINIANINRPLTTVTRGGNIEYQQEEIDDTLKQFDLLIFPLESTPWNLAKNANRLIKAIALGIPVLASATPEHKRVLGELGLSYKYLVEDDSSWQDAVSAIEDDFKIVQSEILAASDQARLMYDPLRITQRWFDEVCNSEKLWKPRQAIAKTNLSGDLDQSYPAVQLLVYDTEIDSDAELICLQSSRINFDLFPNKVIISAHEFKGFSKEISASMNWDARTLSRAADYFELYKEIDAYIENTKSAYTLFIHAGAALLPSFYDWLRKADLSEATGSDFVLLKEMELGKKPLRAHSRQEAQSDLLIDPHVISGFLLKNNLLKSYDIKVSHFGSAFPWAISTILLGDPDIKAEFPERPSLINIRPPELFSDETNYVRHTEVFGEMNFEAVNPIHQKWRMAKDIIHEVASKNQASLAHAYSSTIVEYLKMAKKP